jgi:hypothetical protein
LLQRVGALLRSGNAKNTGEITSNSTTGSDCGREVKAAVVEIEGMGRGQATWTTRRMTPPAIFHMWAIVASPSASTAAASSNRKELESSRYARAATVALSASKKVKLKNDWVSPLSS